MPDPTADPARWQDLVRRAQAVLEHNRSGAYTCPSLKLYPHQWLWDSCFTAIGIARYDPPRAASRAPVPVRRPIGQRHAPACFSPRARTTSAGGQDVTIAAPPRHAPRRRRRRWSPPSRRSPPFAVEYVAHTLPTDNRAAFLDEMLPKLAGLPPLAVPRHRTLDDSALIT